MVTSQDSCEDKRWQYVSYIWIYLRPHCNIYEFVSYGNHFWPKRWSHAYSVPWENCHIWFFGMLVPLHIFHYFQSTIYSLQGCKGPQMVFYLRTRNPRTIACWLCYPHTNTPTLARRIDAPPPSYPQPRRVSWRAAMRIDDTNLILNKTSTNDGVDGCLSWWPHDYDDNADDRDDNMMTVIMPLMMTGRPVMGSFPWLLNIVLGPSCAAQWINGPDMQRCRWNGV